MRAFPFFALVKVLILHQHFKSPQGGGAIRSYYLAKALVENGVDTVVITAHNERGYKTVDLEGIKVHYVPVAYDNRFGFYRRVFSFYRFLIKAVKVASGHRDADLCYAISTPLTTGLAARAIMTKYGIPYVFEVGDLWPDAPVQMGFVKNPLVRNTLYRIERLIYRQASAIVALSEPIRGAILEKEPGKEVHVIPNMADTEFFRPEEKQPSLVAKFGVEGKFVVSYVGALGFANGLEYFLDCAAASLTAIPSVHFILCGDGAMIDALKRRAAKLQLTNLTILPFQNRDGVREVLNVTDANFVSYLPFQILETGSPNKYFDGLAAGKLTIINFSGWIREEIERVQCGIYVDPANPVDFAEKIKAFLVDDELLRVFQYAGRNLAEARYSRQVLSRQYVEGVASRWTLVTG